MEGLGAASSQFSLEQGELVQRAEQCGARLLPTGMHPWMPATKAEAWPHGDAAGDKAVVSLFGKARHGHCNQHALRLSIPFANELEFERLFGALRFLMPLMPALSASSPFAEGKRGPALSCRVAARRDLFASDIEFADKLVPKASTCFEQYRNEVTAPLESALESRGLLAALDPLQVCAHGITADFDTGFVHVEILDMQECMQANIAVCAAIGAMVMLVQSEEHAALTTLGHWPRARLGELLEQSLVDGGRAVFRDSEFSRTLGFPEGGDCRVSDLCQHLMEEKLRHSPLVADSLGALERIVAEGSLATRLLGALPPRWTGEDLYNLYRRIVEASEKDELL